MENVKPNTKPPEVKLGDVLDYTTLASIIESKQKNTVEIGGKAGEQLREELVQNNVVTQIEADLMLKSLEFITAQDKETITIVHVTLTELGFTRKPQTYEVYERALKLGLDFCPRDTGPSYRIQYKNQPLGECLFVGMNPILIRGNSPYIFVLKKSGDDLYLEANSTYPEEEWPSLDMKFVFKYTERNSNTTPSTPTSSSDLSAQKA